MIIKMTQDNEDNEDKPDIDEGVTSSEISDELNELFSHFEEKIGKFSELADQNPEVKKNEDILGITLAIEMFIEILTRNLNHLATDRKLLKALAKIYWAAFEEFRAVGFNDDQIMNILSSMKDAISNIKQ